MRIKGFVLAVAAGAAALMGTARVAADDHVEAPPPDILWIITDDHRPDSIRAFNRAVYGQDNSPLGYVESPYTDQLAAEGVLFTHAYNQAPTCGPSRTSMHTGRYPFRNGKYGWERTHQRMDFARPSVSQLMAHHGYSTALIGKSHYSIRPNRESDGSWMGDAMTQRVFQTEIEFNRDLSRNGFGDWSTNGAYGLIDSILYRRDSTETIFFPDGRQETHTLAWADRPLNDEEKAKLAEVDEQFDILRAYTRINDSLILGGVNPKPVGETIDDYIVDAFQEFLTAPDGRYKTFFGGERNGPSSDKPLFVNLGFHLPHTPVLPPAEYRERFADKDYAIPAFDTDMLSSMPPQLIETYNEAKTDQLTDAEKLQAIRDYYAFTAYGDALIGEAVASFKAQAEARGREWLIVYTVGDHGWHLGEQGIMGKFGPWEQSLRGAVIVVGSDKDKWPAGEVHHGFVEYVDFAPTILSAGGIDIARPELGYLDGYDLGQVLSDPALARDYIIGEQNLVNGHMAYMRTKDFSFSMRSRDRRVEGQSPNLNDDLIWALTTQPKKADLALYDLRIDPGERYNLATTLEYDDLAAWFRTKLGRIVLGDGRVEADWREDNSFNLSNFAGGADDKKADIPAEIIPEPQIIRPGPNR